MTCKDCIYCEKCLSHISYMMGVDDITGKLENDIENRCKDFKDKSKYIELPCKVGDVVYHYCKEIHVILPYLIEQMVFVDKIIVNYDKSISSNSSCLFEAMCLEEDKICQAIDFTPKDIGKTVFLTKEEAERKLKEM